MFDHFESLPVFHALNLAVSRLAILEVEALTAEDPLYLKELMPHSRWSRYSRMALYPISCGVIALFLQIISGIWTDEITDLNEGITILTRNPWLTFLAVILGALVVVLPDLYSRIAKER